MPATVIVAILLSRPLLDRAPFTSLLAAVLFVAWHGGQAPAPRGTLQVSSPSDIVGLVVFFAVALFAGRVTARVREAMLREQAARTEAERQQPAGGDCRGGGRF